MIKKMINLMSVLSILLINSIVYSNEPTSAYGIILHSESVKADTIKEAKKSTTTVNLLSESAKSKYGFEVIDGVIFIVNNNSCYKSDDEGNEIVKTNNLYSTRNALSDKLLVYPNPTNGVITIEMIGEEEKKIELFNAIGELIYTTSGFSNREKVDLTNRSTGNYYLRIINGNEVITKSIIKK